jgi:hypothetical protein
MATGVAIHVIQRGGFAPSCVRAPGALPYSHCYFGVEFLPHSHFPVFFFFFGCLCTRVSVLRHISVLVHAPVAWRTTRPNAVCWLRFGKLLVSPGKHMVVNHFHFHNFGCFRNPDSKAAFSSPTAISPVQAFSIHNWLNGVGAAVAGLHCEGNVRGLGGRLVGSGEGGGSLPTATVPLGAFGSDRPSTPPRQLNWKGCSAPRGRPFLHVLHEVA